jgi:tripartite-type tricarboxylate transporter receptor subunit TctC
MLSPTTPADITSALRDGFDKTMADPEFLQFATKMRLDLNPVTGVAMEKLLADIYRTPAGAVERAKAVIK